MFLFNPLFIVGFIAFIVCTRLLVGILNKARIRSYVTERGGQVLQIRWSPFGKGWIGEKDAVLYEVIYREPDGAEHKATCKTALLSGVYFTEDNVISLPQANERIAELEAENRLLRQEVQKIKTQEDRYSV